MNEEIRVRFAPSPTGPLHIGGVRTALYNYLFARKHNGKFILRIEDTDQTRYVPGAEEYIVESLKWLGINFDEAPHIGGPYAPYRQSERKEIYKQYALQLIEKGYAYYAFDTPEELEKVRKSTIENSGENWQYDTKSRTKMKNSLTLPPTEIENYLKSGIPYVIRFKMPENETVLFTDLIRGEVKVNTNTLDDKVLFKSDGMPTYHLANVVDDHLMKISHVIRGEEWLPSTPLHILLYKAFGWETKMPKFAHLPLILRPDGNGKLSKRDGDKLGIPVYPIEWKDPQTGEIYAGYRESGYFPEAVVNILALLGWNPGTEQEIFSINELCELFSLNNVNKAGARFDVEKSKWFNQQYLRKKSTTDLVNFLKNELLKNNINPPTHFTEKTYENIIDLIKERATFLKDIYQLAHFFFSIPQEYDYFTLNKKWTNSTEKILTDIKELLITKKPKNATEFESIIKYYINNNQLQSGQIMLPLRISIVGAPQGPDLFKIMEIIGCDETCKRIEILINKFNKKNE